MTPICVIPTYGILKTDFVAYPVGLPGTPRRSRCSPGHIVGKLCGAAFSNQRGPPFPWRFSWAPGHFSRVISERTHRNPFRLKNVDTLTKLDVFSRSDLSVPPQSAFFLCIISLISLVFMVIPTILTKTGAKSGCDHELS